MKYQNITIIVLVFLFLNSCSSNKVGLETQTVQKKAVQETEYYTYDEYKRIYEKDLLGEDFVLTMNELNLLNKRFRKATKKEIKEDMAYNRKSIKYAKRYNDIAIFLKKKNNLQMFLDHLNYKKPNLKFVITKKDQAIIYFFKQTDDHAFSETYLISIEGSILKIKLIDYIHAS